MYDSMVYACVCRLLNSAVETTVCGQKKSTGYVLSFSTAREVDKALYSAYRQLEVSNTSKGIQPDVKAHPASDVSLEDLSFRFRRVRG